jgi:hypothetical protein
MDNRRGKRGFIRLYYPGNNNKMDYAAIMRGLCYTRGDSPQVFTNITITDIVKDICSI